MSKAYLNREMLYYTSHSIFNERHFTMAIIMVYKMNPEVIDLSELVEKLSSSGLTDTLQKYYNKPFEKEAKSIVAGKFPTILEQVISHSNYNWRHHTLRICGS